MDNFNLDELMDLAEAYVGAMVIAIYRRLMDRDFALEDPEVVMLLTALINILGHDNRGDRSSLASGGVTETGKIPLLLSDTGEGEAARGPGKPSLLLDEIEKIPRGKGCEGAFASSVRPEQRTTASLRTVRAHTRNLL